MRRLLACATVMLVLLAAGTGYAQDNSTIVLNDAALGAHHRPLVVFPHADHQDIIACTRCHHDFDEYGANQADGDGSKCSDCHTRTPGKNPIALARAFHLQCKGCHEKMRATGVASPPVMCGQCHRRHPATK